MKCEHYQEQFVEYLLCELSATEEQSIQQHLESGCAACNAEFLAIRDGAELLFSVAPQAEFSQAKRDAILAHALAATCNARPQLADNRSSSSTRAVAGRRETRLHPLHGLLALVAGFALVLALPVASRIEPVSTALDPPGGETTKSGLEGLFPAPSAMPNFISFENVSQLAKPENLRVSGFLLLDTRAGEIHLLGSQLVPDLPGTPALDLQITTASGTSHYPLSFNSSGLCKLLVPLPQEPILKIESVHRIPLTRPDAPPSDSVS